LLGACGRVWWRKLGKFAGDPGGEFISEEEGACSFLIRWLENVAGVAELAGKWRELQRVG